MRAASMQQVPLRCSASKTKTRSPATHWHQPKPPNSDHVSVMTCDVTNNRLRSWLVHSTLLLLLCVQVVIITGANSGLGKESARVLAARGAGVLNRAAA